MWVTLELTHLPSRAANAGLSVVLNQAIELAEILNVTVPSNWSEIASNITILETPGGIVIESGGFNSTSPVKQADVVLLIYPLEYEEDASALVDLDYYAGATSASGPGMTYSVFSVDESQLATSGCAAYTYMLAASQPYSREPYYQFSEQTGDVYASNGELVFGADGSASMLTRGRVSQAARTRPSPS